MPLNPDQQPDGQGNAKTRDEIALVDTRDLRTMIAPPDCARGRIRARALLSAPATTTVFDWAMRLSRSRARGINFGRRPVRARS
jgi:hypothetical protein